MLPRTRCARRPVTPALFLALCAPILGAPFLLHGAETAKPKPSPDDVLKLLKAGNERFASGKAENPRTDAARLQLAGHASQADYAYATVLSCSDSRVPVERIFDAGVMDLFVVRVAGNVCNTDEIGSIEYGLAHVRTPVLVILGHTQCGAVTAVTQHLQGHGHALERNIPPLVKSIEPAVRRAMQENATLSGAELVAKGIECNVWTGIENLFHASPAVRDLAAKNQVKVVGAIYDVGTGRVDWLPENQVYRILGRVEMDPYRAMDAMAPADDTARHGDTHPEPQRVTNPSPAAGGLAAGAHAAPSANRERSAHAAAAEPGSSPHPGGGSGGASESPHERSSPHGHSPVLPAAEKADGHGAAPAGHGAPHDEKSEGQGGAEQADAPAPAGRPWGLIAICGIVFVLGLSVALAAHFMREKAETKPASEPAATAQAASAAKPPAAPAAAASAPVEQAAAPAKK